MHLEVAEDRETVLVGTPLRAQLGARAADYSRLLAVLRETLLVRSLGQAERRVHLGLRLAQSFDPRRRPFALLGIVAHPRVGLGHLDLDLTRLRH